MSPGQADRINEILRAMDERNRLQVPPDPQGAVSREQGADVSIPDPLATPDEPGQEEAKPQPDLSPVEARLDALTETVKALLDRERRLQSLPLPAPVDAEEDESEGWGPPIELTEVVPHIEPRGRMLPEAPKLPWPARLLHEAATGNGEYDQWREVEPDDGVANGWQPKPGGKTHENTESSLWEANGREGIPTSSVCAWSRIVWVHEEENDEHRFVFDYQYDGMADGIADYDILYWDNALEEWKILSFADADFKVLQRKADDSMDWDWVRCH